MGHLVLIRDGIASAEELVAAISVQDQLAERFRLAASWSLRRPIAMRLTDSQEPDFSPRGALSARALVRLTDCVSCEVTPRPPPATMPQLSEDAARWVHTMAETAPLSPYPDEVLKRLYLLIEEHWDSVSATASDAQREQERQAKLVRHFVSHATCDNKQVVAFVREHLPIAIVPGATPPAVRFDRTSLEHRNFVGRFDPVAGSLAIALVNGAIAHLTPRNAALF